MPSSDSLIPVPEIDTTEIDSRASDICAEATWLEITSDEQYHKAASFLVGVVKAAQKRIRETFGPLKKSAKATHQAIVDMERMHAGPVADAETTIKAKMLAWDTKQRELREAEQKRLHAIAMKDAEEKRAAERAEAEKERLRIAEERRLEEESAAKDRAEKAAEAEALREAGKAAEAEALKAKQAEDDAAAAIERQAKALADAEALKAEEARLAAPVVAPVVTIAEPDTKANGVSYRDVWRYRIVDEALIPREYLKVDTAKIRAEVTASKGDTAIPGVEAYAEKQISGRAR